MAACTPPARGKGVGVGEVHFLECSAGLLLVFFFFFHFFRFFFSCPFFSLYPAAMPFSAGRVGRVEGTVLSPLPVLCVTSATRLKLGISLLLCRPPGWSPEGLCSCALRGPH